MGSYNRYVLCPKSPADATELLEKENAKAVVVPMDDYLRVTGLPFKKSAKPGFLPIGEGLHPVVTW